MSFWDSFCSWFGGVNEGVNMGSSVLDTHCDINPANGLPMVGGCGGVDIKGNAYGTDWSHHDSWGAIGTSWDDSFSSSSSNWNTGIGSSWDD